MMFNTQNWYLHSQNICLPSKTNIGIVQKTFISMCGFQAYTTQMEEIFVTYGSGMFVEDISARDVREFIELSTSTDHSFIVNQVITENNLLPIFNLC